MIRSLFWLSLKGIGPNVMVPAFSFLLVDGVLIYFSAFDLLTKDLILLMSDWILAPLSGWCVLFVFQPIVEEEGGQLFRSFPLNLKAYGTANVLLLFGLQCVAVGLNTLFLRIAIGADAAWNWIAFRQALLSLFLMSLSFAAMMFTRDVSMSIVVVLAYILCSCFLADYIPIYMNVFQNAQRFSSIADQTIASLPVAVFGSWILLGIAQGRLERG